MSARDQNGVKPVNSGYSNYRNQQQNVFFRELFKAPFVILVCDEKHSEKDQDAHHLEL